MSFILDALRKSDAQRRRGVAPALLTPQAPPVTLERSRILSYGLFAAALVAVGIGIGTLRPWHAEQSAAATQAATAESREPGATAAASLPLPRQQEAARRSAPSVSKQKSPAGAQFASAPAVAATSVRPSDVARAPKVAAFAELPASIQQEIPSLQISAHAYSPIPKDRLIGINDRVLREGEHAAPGLLLEQITPDGMILSYKGYRFRRGVR